jgi:HSP20 family protein
MPRTGPWRRDLAAPFHVLQGELNRIFDEYVNPARYTGGQTPPVDLEPATWIPALDLVETADSYVLTAEVPGVDPASIDLSVTGNVLSLRGVKPGEAPDATAPLHERQYGPFYRQVVLSTEVDFDGAQAEARDGVLRIRLPKQEAAKPRTIPVKTT